MLRIAHVGLRPGRDEPERPRLRDAEDTARAPGARPGREGEPARAGGDARRLAQPRPPRSDEARRRRPADREVAPRLLRDGADRGRDRRGLRRAARARAAGGGVRRRPRLARRAAPLPRAARGDRRCRLARRVGLGQRRLPRVPGRPRPQRAPVALLPRPLDQPDDAGDPRRQARGRLLPADRARRDRRRVRGRRPRCGAQRRSGRTSPPAAGSRSRRSRAAAASSSHHP